MSYFGLLFSKCSRLFFQGSSFRFLFVFGLDFREFRHYGDVLLHLTERSFSGLTSKVMVRHQRLLRLSQRNRPETFSVDFVGFKLFVEPLLCEVFSIYSHNIRAIFF